MYVNAARSPHRRLRQRECNPPCSLSPWQPHPSQYADFRRILAESAQEHGAKLRTGIEVVGVHPDAQRPHVTLASGEVLSADVIIGADGVFTPMLLCRKHFLEKSQTGEVVSAKHMQLFQCVPIGISGWGRMERGADGFLCVRIVRLYPRRRLRG